MGVKSKNQTGKQGNVVGFGRWLMSGFLFVGLLFVTLLVFFVFYDLMPVALFFLGHTIGILPDTTSDTMNVVDAMIYLLTGASFVGVLSYGLIGYLKWVGRQLCQLFRDSKVTMSHWISSRKSNKKK